MLATCPREALEEPIVEAALRPAGEGPSALQVIHGPRGAGKTTLLHRVSGLLAGRGALPVILDFEKICTNPYDFSVRFASAVERAAHLSGLLPPERRTSPRAQELTAERKRSRPDPSRMIDIATGHAGEIAGLLDKPMVLLLDEMAEASRFSRHPGMRRGHARLARLLLELEGVSILATLSPASRPAAFQKLLEKAALDVGRDVREIHVPPFSAREMAIFLATRGMPTPVGTDVTQAWLKATGGRPHYAHILADRVLGAAASAHAGPQQLEDLASAVTAELTPLSGRLHQECRFDYHILTERSRGDSVVRTILEVLARDEGANLSTIARHLGVSLPTALDYLSWLREVALIRRSGRGYIFQDPLLALWVRLNMHEPCDTLEEVVRYLQEPLTDPLPPARPRGRKPGSRPAPADPERSPAATDLLMEID